MKYAIRFVNKSGIKSQKNAVGLAQLLKELYKVFKGGYAMLDTVEIISYK